jgi:hypothetical protein
MVVCRSKLTQQPRPSSVCDETQIRVKGESSTASIGPGSKADTWEGRWYRVAG